MMRRFLWLAIIILGVGQVAWGAADDFQKINSRNMEMQKSLVWLTEGLRSLGNSKDAKLQLTKEQKTKILPLFQALIDQKLVLLEVNKNNRPGAGGNSPGQLGQGGQPPQSGQTGQPGQPGPPPGFNSNDPQMQNRIQQMQALTAFGNQQMDKIDAILTAAQRSFVDNLDFKPEQYGLGDAQTMPVPQGVPGQTGSAGQSQPPGGDQKAFQEMQRKMQAGQAQLVKLNNEVLKMLKG